MIAAEPIALSDAGLPPVSQRAAAAKAMDRTLHDLGQPLTSLAIALELLAHDDSCDSRLAMLAAARQECSRAIRSVEELRRHTINLLHPAEPALKENA